MNLFIVLTVGYVLGETSVFLSCATSGRCGTTCLIKKDVQHFESVGHLTHQISLLREICVIRKIRDSEIQFSIVLNINIFRNHPHQDLLYHQV
jgi:hypothetical protein